MEYYVNIVEDDWEVDEYTTPSIEAAITFAIQWALSELSDTSEQATSMEYGDTVSILTTCAEYLELAKDLASINPEDIEGDIEASNNIGTVITITATD